MTLDLATVVREAAARWRQDRALLLPMAGLLLFVPQWTVLLLVPDMPAGIADPDNAAAMTQWALAVQRWGESWGLLCLAASLVAQWGMLAIVALYVPTDGVGAGGAGRSTVAQALARAGRRLPRYVLAQLMVWLPLFTAGVVGSAAPPVLVVLVPVLLWLLGRALLLVAPVILARRGTGAAAAVVLSWRWSRGNGAVFALLAGVLLIGVPIAVKALRDAAALLGSAALGAPVVVAALDAAAAAIAAAAMLAFAMSVAVLYRRLAR